MRVDRGYIFLYAVLILAFVGCDVHEFPIDNNNDIEISLQLAFDKDMPLHTTINYSRSGNNGSEQHDIRYIINAYRTDNGESRRADTTFIFTKSDITDLNYSTRIKLHRGNYNLRVWADYVNSGSKEDKYYDTSNFEEIIILNKTHHAGSNDYRDAFVGNTEIALKEDISTSPTLLDAKIEMYRPMGKFSFVATDGEEFISNIVQKMIDEEGLSNDNSNLSYEQMLQKVDLNQFNIIFHYNAFMPCSFNMFTDKPADSWTNMTFSSRMQSRANKEIELGFDYIFVNNKDTSLNISVEIYDKNGVLLSASKPIDVPIVRNKLTLVKGSLLTPSISDGGTTINPGFDGDDYNIEI